MNKILSDDELLCPIRYALNTIGGKWKLPILCLLATSKPTRYGEIKKKIPGITNMMLAQSLKELESAGIVNRKQYNEIPPKVEYTLTNSGKNLLPTLKALADWGSSQIGDEASIIDTCKACKTAER